MAIKCCLDKELSSAVRPLANPSPICIRDRHFRWQYRVDESEILDLSIDLNAVSLDAEIPLNELEDGGIERVPMADPGMDVSRNGYVYPQDV